MQGKSVKWKVVSCLRRTSPGDHFPYPLTNALQRGSLLLECRHILFVLPVTPLVEALQRGSLLPQRRHILFVLPVTVAYTLAHQPQATYDQESL